MFGEPCANAGQAGDPFWGRCAVTVCLYSPAEPFPDFACRIGRGNHDGNDEKCDDENDRNRCADSGVAADIIEQLAVKRPTGEADDQRGQYRH
ncbi:hypothetical protein D3C80_1538870 [compost metagenome]